MLFNREIFYAKILLFGEYSVIYGSMAISVPYGHYRGELAFLDEDKYTDYDKAVESNKKLKLFLEHLQKNALEMIKIIDLDTLAADIQRGIYFESTIPQGFGLGSSGSLTSAIFAKYSWIRNENRRQLMRNRIFELKNQLARVESYFHGTSSGFDPLSSFVKAPVLIRSNEDIRVVPVPRNKDYGEAGILLLNTGIPRKTGELVERFTEKMNSNHDFKDHILREYIPVNNRCIDSVIKGDVKSFARNLSQLSRMQIEDFPDMIPQAFHQIWKESLESREMYLKLCGAGGGGFLLAFSKHVDRAINRFQEAGFETVTVYRSR